MVRQHAVPKLVHDRQRRLERGDVRGWHHVEEDIQKRTLVDRALQQGSRTIFLRCAMICCNGSDILYVLRVST